MTGYAKSKNKQLPAYGAEVLSGFIPPQDLEAEQSLLGAMLIEAAAIDAARVILHDPKDFYREAHQTLYTTILRLADRNEAVDLITIQGELKKHDQLEAIGGVSYLAVLYDRVPTAVNVEYYAKLVALPARCRRYIAASFQLIGVSRGSTTEQDLDESVAVIIRSIDEGQTEKVTGQQLGALSLKLYDEADDRAEALRAGGQKVLPSIPYPFRLLQRWTGGMRGGQLLVLAARPSMGKTSLAIFILLMAAFSGKRVLFVSLETQAEIIAQRCICMIAMISPEQIRDSDRLTEQQWFKWHEQATLRFQQLDFEIYAPPSLSPSQLATRIRQMEREGRKPDLVAIDYVQLMKPDEKGERRDLTVQLILSAIKVIAREMDFPLLALSQVSRVVESAGRKDKRPTMADARESGAFENDADVYISLYREGYYADKSGHFVDSTQGQLVEILVQKNKEGPTGLVKGWLTLFCGKWEDDDEDQNNLNMTAPLALPAGKVRQPYAADNDQSEDMEF